MFKKLFGKDSDDENVLEKVLSVAKTFGVNIPKLIEKELPKLVQQAREVQEKAGRELFLTIALDKEGKNFVLALWKMEETGADRIKGYVLADPIATLNQIQQDLNNISDDAGTYKAEPVAVGSTGRTTEDDGDGGSPIGDIG